MKNPKGDLKNCASSRREFLRKALRTTAYTAPIIAAMSMRNLAVAQPSDPGWKGKGMMG
ncbi:MAG: hypothetical protein HYY16_05530 [Planctomycetes bacterium]|nr:hypothetical protein [Planctomycetota bacterium]